MTNNPTITPERRASPASSHLRSVIFCRSNRSRLIDTWSTSVQIPPRLTWIFGTGQAHQRWRDRSATPRGRRRGSSGAGTGIKTDAQTRALDADGRVIGGLYAAGNDLASIMGGNYPGAGITLGPALGLYRRKAYGCHVKAEPSVPSSRRGGFRYDVVKSPNLWSMFEA